MTVSRRGGVAEAVGDQQAPVPVGLRVGLRVDLAQRDRGVDVAALVVDPQVELEVGPVGRKRVEDLLEVRGQSHAESVDDQTGEDRRAGRR